MPPPIDPLRLRIFSELNLQLSHPSIPKSLLNETSKHLAFLVRYYANDAFCDPLTVSVPIVEVPVPVVGGGWTGDGETEMAMKIALVVFDGPGEKRVFEQGSSMGGYEGTTAKGEMGKDDGSMTPTEKLDGKIKPGVSAKKLAGARRCASTPSSPAAVASVPSKVARPRFRVLIALTGTLGHHKCLIGRFCDVAERVVGGLLAGDRDIVEACEGDKKGKGEKKASGEVQSRPVWDMEACGNYC
jgi:hypothetical protein